MYSLLITEHVSTDYFATRSTTYHIRPFNTYAEMLEVMRSDKYEADCDISYRLDPIIIMEDAVLFEDKNGSWVSKMTRKEFRKRYPLDLVSKF